MRRVLVDHARARAAAKRGGGATPITFDESAHAAAGPPDALALSAARDALAAFDEFGGLTQEEIAAALGLYVNTGARELRLAEAWLRGRLKEGA